MDGPPRVFLAARVTEQFVDLARWHWATEDEPLSEGAAHLLKKARLLVGLDPLGDRLEAKIPNQCDDRADQLGLADVLSHLTHEASIDLDAVEW